MGGITIVNTYAPRMCYNTGEREEYWEIGNTLKSINNKDCIIWGSDNNGQVAKENKGKQEKNQSVGHWAMATKTEQGKWIKLVEKCNKYILAITNTMFTPKRGGRKTWKRGEAGWGNTKKTGLRNNK